MGQILELVYGKMIRLCAELDTLLLEQFGDI